MPTSKFRWLATGIALMLVLTALPSSLTTAQGGSRTFPETGKTVSGARPQPSPVRTSASGARPAVQVARAAHLRLAVPTTPTATAMAVAAAVPWVGW